MAWKINQWKQFASPVTPNNSEMEDLEIDLISSIYDNLNSTAYGENGTGEVQKLEPYQYTIATVFLSVILAVGSVGNLMVMVMIGKDRQLQTPFNMFLFSMSFVDFTTVVLGTPVPLFTSIMHKWMIGEIVCRIQAFVMAFGGVTKVLTLTWLAIQRYLTIRRCCYTRNTKTCSIKSLGLVLTCSLLLTSPPFFGVSSYGPEGSPPISCSVSWNKEDDGVTKIFACCLLSFGFFIPVVIIFTFYGSIIWTLIRRPHLRQLEKIRAEQQGTLMVGVMIAFFLISWLPYAVLVMVRVFGDPAERQKITPVMSVSAAVFAKLSTCYNPFIYLLLNTQFRTSWCKIFTCCRGQEAAPPKVLRIFRFNACSSRVATHRSPSQPNLHDGPNEDISIILRQNAIVWRDSSAASPIFQLVSATRMIPREPAQPAEDAKSDESDFILESRV